MFRITEAAAAEIVRQDRGRNREVQIMVLGGKCNGFYYHMSWRDSVAMLNRDHLFEEHGAKVFIDHKSYLHLDECTLDHDPLKGFIFDNKKVVSSCGCGRSVSF